MSYKLEVFFHWEIKGATAHDVIIDRSSCHHFVGCWSWHVMYGSVLTSAGFHQSFMSLVVAGLSDFWVCVASLRTAIEMSTSAACLVANWRWCQLPSGVPQFGYNPPVCLASKVSWVLLLHRVPSCLIASLGWLFFSSPPPPSLFSWVLFFCQGWLFQLLQNSVCLLSWSTHNPVFLMHQWYLFKGTSRLEQSSAQCL